MSDDEDYMSDKFLELSEKCATPSLVYRHTDKRQFELEKRKEKMKEKNKPMTIIEHEKREEGLSNAITSANKGFALLMKMGYKPGQGLGKKQSGIVEPIEIKLKEGRHGLGQISRKRDTKAKTENTKLDNSHVTDFRGRMAEKKFEQMLKADLYKSQKICQQLDIAAGIEKSVESWFWLNDIDTKEDEKGNIVEKEEEEEEEEEKEEEEEEEEEEIEEEEKKGEELTVNEKLDILTKYLRAKYFYCIWCGVLFDDEDDLRDNCPGWTRNDH